MRVVIRFRGAVLRTITTNNAPTTGDFFYIEKDSYQVSKRTFNLNSDTLIIDVRLT